MSKEDSNSNADLEWQNRRLCVDESCIGVIGPDGCCKECGKRDPEAPASPAENDTSVPASAESEEENQQDSAAAEAVSHDDDEEFAGIADEEWENRTLCIDESCIGVVGPDGCCKECGKPYSSNT